jgi:dTDP-4-amino-4,6-dideoxygalactose transaminase
MNQPIYITKPSVPPLEEFNYLLKKIWKSRVFTNNGVFHKKLESKLSLYTSNKNVSLFCNGTMALIMALKALKLKGEVITTPYTFAATSHSLLWCNLKPVFCDVNINDYNIDPSKIEALITEKTSAILAVHCYGIPCDVKALEKIAKKYSLKRLKPSLNSSDCYSVIKSELLSISKDLIILSKILSHSSGVSSGG